MLARADDVFNRGNSGYNAALRATRAKVYRPIRPMFRVTLACRGVPAEAGAEAASDIQQEFLQHRQHHKNVVCTFTNGELVLTAENDFDAHGLALMDEFSDCIAAYIADGFDGEIRVVSTTTI